MSSYVFFSYAAQFVGLLVYVLTAAIFLRAIFSWFVPPGSDNRLVILEPRRLYSEGNIRRECKPLFPLALPQNGNP